MVEWFLRFDNDEEDDDVQTIEEVILEGWIENLWQLKPLIEMTFRTSKSRTKAKNDAKAIAWNDWCATSNSI